MSHAEIRALCHDEAMKWVDIQRDQFRRLGVSGDWDHPYLTLDPRYEAGILDVLADLLEGGYVFRQLKPIHWCMTDRTALAEAELEYHDETTPSIYVNFPMVSGVPASWGDGPWHAMIWTTTPWTLPPTSPSPSIPSSTTSGVRYVDPDDRPDGPHDPRRRAGREGHGPAEGRRSSPIVGRCRGRDLEHAEYRHVFIDRDRARSCWPTTSASRTARAGPHRARPRRRGLPDRPASISFRRSARSTPRAGSPTRRPTWLVGKQVFAANPDDRRDAARRRGICSTSCRSSHSYPHCWRCKKPVIFRATEQWFIGVDHDDLRGRTLEAIDEVRWLPAWGQSRIEAMVSHRPDWCISRQRSWGVPIPALGCDDLRHAAPDGRDRPPLPRPVPHAKGPTPGSPSRSRSSLPPGAACPQCGGTDVPQGGRHPRRLVRVGLQPPRRARRAELRPGGSPAFMYLEGSDQHRGWFQSSILTAVGDAPAGRRSRRC